MALAKYECREVLTMKFDYLSKRLGGYALAFFVLFGMAAVGSSSAQGQWRRDDRRYDRDDWRRDRYYNNGFQVARQQGYRYGLNAGSVDAQRNRRFDPQRSSTYRKGTEGYNSSFGNKGQYKQIFRDAFVQGYREGYQRFAYNRRDNGRWVNGVWRPW
jgi:hypothetical protein